MHDDDSRQLEESAGRFIRRELWLAATVYLFLFVAALVTDRSLSPDAGRHYRLGARGLGAVSEAFFTIVVLTGFSVLYGLTSFMVRRWIGCAVRTLMLALFVGFLTFMHMEKVIAVTRTPDGFVLHRRWPRAKITVPARDLREFRLDATGAVHALHLRYAVSRSQEAEVDVEPVFNWDRKTRGILDELVGELERSGAQRLAPLQRE